MVISTRGLLDAFGVRGICDIGDRVIYTGESGFASDEHTKELMEEYLIPGNAYTITDILTNYNEVSGDYHYRLLECGYWYPCESFNKSYKEFLSNKYFLK